MTEYIERDAAIRIAEKYGTCNGSVLGRHSGVADCIASEIAGLPAADVAPVARGRWIPQSNNAGGEYTICSACRRSLRVAAQTGNESGLMDMRSVPYCPNCGAKMYGGVDDAGD